MAVNSGACFFYCLFELFTIRLLFHAELMILFGKSMSSFYCPQPCEIKGVFFATNPDGDSGESASYCY